MNAIILAAGKSSRMYSTGALVHKALLPIMGIPNIERTIMMLNDQNIQDIIVAVPEDNQNFDYLVEKFFCKVVKIPSEGKNTLYTIKYLLNYIHETFIIEGDVVCAHNIFLPLKSSVYFIMKYANPEQDAWHPIFNESGEIISFEVEKKSTPALFGVSFWTGFSAKILKEHILSINTIENLNNPDIFWDDFISEILPQIRIKAIEIKQEEAFEMNTYEEYLTAQTICEKYLFNCQQYFEHMDFEHTLKGRTYHVHYTLDRLRGLKWQEKLLRYYNEEYSDKHKSLTFSDNEFPFIIVDSNGNEYGYFSIAEDSGYILLRRLFIESTYRHNGVGSKVLHFTLTYARLKSKELRVNVYDTVAESFYKKFGFKRNYICYHIR